MRLWDSQICAAIPVHGSPDAVKVCIDTLRCQTARPYIVLVDTGSNPNDFAKIEALRAGDCEVHTIRTHGTIHPHDNVASAMDLAFSICRSPYLLATHADCFLKRRELLAEMVRLCQTESPIVGYGMSPRNFPAYRWMVSHVCTMFDMAAMDRINAGWSHRRLAVLFGDGNRHVHEPKRPGWPDPELLVNYQADAAGIRPHRIGREPRNDLPFEDESIEHVRGLAHVGANLAVKSRLDGAMDRARNRLAAWGNCRPQATSAATDGVTLITATSDRPEAFRLCEHWMSRQTYRGPLQWIVVDDGDTPVVPTMGQTHIRRDPGLSGRESLVANLLAAIPHVQQDAVLLVEDDDWYAPMYVETMVERLGTGAMIVGEARSKYYNVATRRFYRCKNHAHASLCQTGIHRLALSHLKSVLTTTSKAFVDAKLWTRLSAEHKQCLAPESELCVGIKGMPGKAGIGVGHRLPASYDCDLGLDILRQWIGDDAGEYEKYWDGSSMAQQGLGTDPVHV